MLFLGIDQAQAQGRLILARAKLLDLVQSRPGHRLQDLADEVAKELGIPSEAILGGAPLAAPGVTP